MSIVISGLIVLTIAIVIILRLHFHKKYPSNPVLYSAGFVDAPLAPKGSVLVNGELWMARSANGLLIPAKAHVTVVGFEDHLLLVTRR